MHENKEIWDKLGKLEKVMTTFLNMGGAVLIKWNW